MLSKVFATQPQERIELREKTNTEDLYAVAVIRRRWPCPLKYMSASCALFLRRNHLQLVLFTRAQSCHEKFDRVRVHCAFGWDLCHVLLARI